MTKEFPMKVFGARMIVRLDEAESKTMGGIIIPGMEKEQVTQGEVVATGEGMRLDNGTLFPMEVHVGDRVILSPTAGSPVALPDDKASYLVVNEAHVLAVMA